MIDTLILHPRTKEQVAQFVARPSHALLLVGNNGMGKTTLAKAMVAAALRLNNAPEQHPYFMLVTPEKDSISIDTIRELQRFLQLKTIGERPLRRAVVVEHAEGLTTEAQNAFLKLLEEPPADTVMILTADNHRALLPTILSRVQQLTMYAPSEDELKAHYTATKEPAAINQAYFLSGGLPGLMHALLDDDTAHPLTAGVALAKEILQKPIFERLAMVESMGKQRDDARYVVRALQHIAQTCLAQAAGKGDEAKLRQWHKILRIATNAEQALGQSANTKLTLSNMMLHL
jgi:DNA polymerase III subunit delta'